MTTASIAAIVAHSLAGQHQANRVIYRVRTTNPDPDALHAELQAVLATNEPERLRAFCRVLQKRLIERADD